MDPTPVLFVATAVVWFALEFWFIAHRQATISARIQMLFRSWPTLGMLTGLAVGLLLGHFFFP